MDARWESKSAVALYGADPESAPPEVIPHLPRQKEPEPVNFLAAPEFLADPAERNNVAEKAVRSLSARAGHDRPIPPGRDVLARCPARPTIRPGEIAQKNSPRFERTVDTSE